MVDSLNQLLLRIVTSPGFGEKIAIGKSLADFPPQPVAPAAQPENLRSPGRPEGFQVVNPRTVPKRGLADAHSRAVFLHAIANIELLAIELPALCLLRFGSQDLGFIADQLAIIAEEARHFELLRNRLEELSCPFGSLPVHHGLWDCAWRCQSELEHQIIIPCHLEARGLDVTPDFLAELKKVGDEKSSAILQLILDEEIGHVKRGNAYLEKTARTRKAKPEDLFEITLRHFFGERVRSKIALNVPIRRRAGFSEAQLSLISPKGTPHAAIAP